MTYDRKSRYYPTIYDLKEEEFAKLGAPNTRADLKVIRGKLKELERSAETAARDISPFSFADFEKEFVLNNPPFLQRKAITDVKVEGNYGYDVAQYAHRFPIFKEPHSTQEAKCRTSFQLRHGHSLKKFSGFVG